jgi:hypothetical protein
MSDGDRLDVLLHQPFYEDRRRRRCDRVLPAGRGIVDDGAVFCDHAVEQREFRKSAPEVREFASGHQQQTPARLLQLPQGLAGLPIDKPMVGDRPVIVGSEGEDVH